MRKLLSTLPPSDSSTFRVDFRSSHVHYINNIEEDSMYKRWRSNLNEVRKYHILIFNILHVHLIFISPCFQLYCFTSVRFYNQKKKKTTEHVQILMPVFPGQLRYIRKNLFHAVSVIDPATICGLEASLCLLVKEGCRLFCYFAADDLND